MSVSAVMFDLDETLFNRSDSLRAFVENQFSGRALGNLGNLRAVGDRFLALDRRGRTSKREVYDALLAETGFPDSAASATLFDDYETNAWRFARAFDGMAELLSWLANSGRRTAIVSNGQTHIQLRSLLALNLDRLVNTYLISEQEGCRKPEPAIFRRAAERLGVSVVDCVFVGDSPEADMIGARSLNMKTIWFPNGAVWPEHYDWQPDAVIGSLPEIRDLIEGWEKAG
ncbi:MAG: HAD family hydrolase [Pseudochelatococcus sp.]|jgi:putative hydrolase of the HAD superfamily|uniref:HAD family hydrolase n=1 Tax=Pseudochelatococcus sp. TaxID=2020869 RepID=UPI003D924D79